MRKRGNKRGEQREKEDEKESVRERRQREEIERVRKTGRRARECIRDK
jgi:hypothetical protein